MPFFSDFYKFANFKVFESAKAFDLTSDFGTLNSQDN